MAGESLLLPSTVLAETCYWLNEHGGPEVEAAFLDAIADGAFTLLSLSASAYARSPLSTVVIFASITPKDGGHFTLLPETL